jgi:hypothetical protein
MNHSQFENWIFAEDLNPEEAKQLHAHLQSCPGCKELDAADLRTRRLLNGSSHTAPAAGFTNRWLLMAHLREEKAQKRQVVILFSVFSTLAVITAVLLITASRQEGFELIPFVQSTLRSFLQWMQRLAITLNSYRFVLSVLPFKVPALVWFFLAGNLGFWVLAWTISIWKFQSIRKVLA